jgi:hypothetical protein
VEKHRALSIADRRGGKTCPLRELPEGEILLRGDIALEIDEDILSVLPSLAFLFLIEMIGEIGCDCFKPLPFLKSANT